MANGFQIGEMVELNGKTYKIVGTHARSYLLEREGKTYKATAAKMTKIQNQQPQTTPLQRRVAYARLFDPAIQYPTTAEQCKYWFDTLSSELSPENLSCDGERSGNQIALARRDILQAWKELEAIVGHKVEMWG